MAKIFTLIIAGLFYLIPLNSHAKVNIFACEPEWHSLAQEIGGDNVMSFSATHAKQDPHYIRAKPSLIAKIRKADLLICSGAGLEVGWLPILLQKANANLTQGSVGNLMAADMVDILEKPQIIDRALGDIHPEGNPHVHLNPHNILKIAKELTKRLSKIDEKNALTYQNNYQEFSQNMLDAINRWEQMATSLKKKKIVAHHKSFAYLFNWLDIKVIASLEPKPGISPTIPHLKNLLRQMKSEPADIIILTPYDSKRAGKWLSKKTDIPLIILPYTVGGNEKSSDLFSLFDNTISLIKNAN